MIYQVVEKRKTDKLLPPLDITEENLEIARDFLESTMLLDGRIVGLAAPQTGLDLRMCAVKAPHWLLAINPKITQTLGHSFKTEESCLSWPNSDVIATRFSNIEVEYYSLETGLVEKKWYSGLESLIWQHECGHLDGVEEVLEPKLGISQQREMFKPKIGRNEPCPCESGKKYKKCCHKLLAFRLA